jgi:hypothetical protein
VVLTFGQTRYRTTFEVSLVLLAAVQLEWFWSRLRRDRSTGAEPGPGQDLGSDPPERVDGPSDDVLGIDSDDGSGDRPGVPAVTT